MPVKYVTSIRLHAFWNTFSTDDSYGIDGKEIFSVFKAKENLNSGLVPSYRANIEIPGSLMLYRSMTDAREFPSLSSVAGETGYLVIFTDCLCMKTSEWKRIVHAKWLRMFLIFFSK
jgi:hypothetical protein